MTTYHLFNVSSYKVHGREILSGLLTATAQHLQWYLQVLKCLLKECMEGKNKACFPHRALLHQYLQNLADTSRMLTQHKPTAMGVLRQDLGQKIFVSWPSWPSTTMTQHLLQKGLGSLEAYNRVTKSLSPPPPVLCPGNKGSSVWLKHQVLRRERVAIQQIMSQFIYTVPDINKESPCDLLRLCFTSLPGKTTNSGALTVLLSGSCWQWHGGRAGPLWWSEKTEQHHLWLTMAPGQMTYTWNLNDITCKMSIILPTILDHREDLMRW